MRAPSPLFHVSEDDRIDVFHPRDSSDGRKLVWAVSAEKLANYLLPRDCPRVCLRLKSTTDDNDRSWVASFGGRALIFVERDWSEKIADARLCVYAFAPDGFTVEDENAGYYVATRAVRPRERRILNDLPSAIKAHDANLIAVNDLWPIRDRAIASTLAFSAIRMRNAAPRRKTIQSTS